MNRSFIGGLGSILLALSCLMFAGSNLIKFKVSPKPKLKGGSSGQQPNTINQLVSMLWRRQLDRAYDSVGMPIAAETPFSLAADGGKIYSMKDIANTSNPVDLIFDVECSDSSYPAKASFLAIEREGFYFRSYSNDPREPTSEKRFKSASSAASYFVENKLPARVAIIMKSKGKSMKGVEGSEEISKNFSDLRKKLSKYQSKFSTKLLDWIIERLYKLNKAKQAGTR